MKRALLSVPAVFTAWAVLAQAPSHVGTWSGTMEGEAGRLIPVEIHLTETGGTWRMSPPVGSGAGARNNPCFGKELPVAVQGGPETLVLEVHGSKVIQGCMDAKVTLTGTGSEYKGQTGRGRAVSLTRK